MRGGFLAALATLPPCYAYLMGGDEVVCIVDGAAPEMGPPCLQYGGLELEWASSMNMDPLAGVEQNILVDVDFQTGSGKTVLSDHGGVNGAFAISIKACDAEIGLCFADTPLSEDHGGYVFESQAQDGCCGGQFNMTYVFPEMDICWSVIAIVHYFVEDDNTNVISEVYASIAVFQVVSSTAKVTINNQVNTVDQTPLIIGLSIAGVLLTAIFIGGIFMYRKMQKGKITFSALEFNEDNVWRHTEASDIFKGMFKGTKIIIKRISTKNKKNDAEANPKYALTADGTRTLKTASINLKSFNHKSKVRGTDGVIFDDDACTGETAGQDAVAALKTEIAFMSDLRHPNCLLYIGYAGKGGHMYAVTEYMPNGSLNEVLTNPSIDFDFEHKMRMSTDIASGLEFLHLQNPPYLHGDLKSQNVFVNDDLRGKIADFGASCAAGTKQVSGTPSWMAPEQFQGHQNTRESDVYALSMTLFELWTAAELYPEMRGKPIKELGAAIINGKRPEINTKSVPSEITAIMTNGWHEEPTSRPDVHQIHLRLRGLQDDKKFMMDHRKATEATDHELLYKILPANVVKQVKEGKPVEPIDCPEVTILFSDIVGFTKISTSLEPKQVMDMLDRLYTKFDELTERHQLFKVETIGDAYMVCGGLFERQGMQASMIALQGMAMIRAGAETQIHPDHPELGNITIRVGAHTGPVVASVVGKLNPRFCLFGDTVNTSSRMESNSIVMRFQGSKPFRDKLMKEDANFITEYRGEVHAKGKAPMTTYWIEAKDAGSKKLIEDFPPPEDKEAWGSMK